LCSDKPLKRLADWIGIRNHPIAPTGVPDGKIGYYPKYGNTRIEATPRFIGVAKNTAQKTLTTSVVSLEEPIKNHLGQRLPNMENHFSHMGQTLSHMENYFCFIENSIFYMDYLIFYVIYSIVHMGQRIFHSDYCFLNMEKRLPYMNNRISNVN